VTPAREPPPDAPAREPPPEASAPEPPPEASTGRRPRETSTRRRPPARRRWSLNSRSGRALLYQALALAVLALAAAWLLHNTLANMRERGIQSGFDFLLQPAGFDIGESLIPYDSNEPYAKAFLVGLLNTLRVALLGIVGATVLGTALGIGRLSKNALLRGFCYGYVELFRNVPLLLQLLMWYLLLTEWLPDPATPMSWFGAVFLSKGGLNLPAPVWPAGAPLGWRWPVAGEVSVTGGLEISPEFMAVLLGLTLYTASYIAEVVRAGIQSVPRGQREAADALGLPPSRQLRLVILPQALRVIIPPLTNQFLNLTKNSSLAVAIGYPDVVSISNTAINQTGRAVECIAVIMAVYLSLSLAISALMNAWNRRAAIRER
jgi:general L-amino acid transport system permease protein